MAMRKVPDPPNAAAASSPRTPMPPAPQPPPQPPPPPSPIDLQLASAYRIGRYTKAERLLRIERYRQKRARRDYSTKVLYECRKKIADRRHRVHGRFVKQPDDDTGGVASSSTSAGAGSSAGAGAGVGNRAAAAVGEDMSAHYLNFDDDK